MRDVKDTLGIKYDKYTSIYKLDNEKVGLLLKYLMWENGKEIILSDVSELTKKRIEKKSKEIEAKIEELLEDEVFEIVFNEMTQQVKRSHKCWQRLKDNLENKKKDNTTTPTTPKEIPTKTPIVTTEEIEESIEDEYKNEVFYIDKRGIQCTNLELLKEHIKDSKYSADDIEKYVFENAKNHFDDDGFLVPYVYEVLEQMEQEGVLSTEEEMSLPI